MKKITEGLLTAFLLTFAANGNAQHGLSVGFLGNNVLTQTYQPGNIAAGEFGTFRASVGGGEGWIGNSHTSLKGILTSDGYITHETRDRIIDNLGNNTVVTAGYKLNLVTANLRLGELVLSLNVAENGYANAGFDNPLTAGLLLKGNGHYPGDTISDSDVFMTYAHTREFGVGAGYSTGDVSFGGRLKFIQGMDMINLHKLDYSLYTSELGTVLDINADYDLRFATSDSGFFRMQGVGAAIDLGMNMNLGDAMRFNVSVLDVGVVSWKTEQYKHTVDVTYEGIEITSLFADDLTEQTQEAVDSLKGLLLPDSITGKSSLMTPMQAQAGFEYDLSEQGTLRGTLVYSPARGGPYTRLPLLDVGYAHELIDGLKLGAHAFGGGSMTYGFGLFGGYEHEFSSFKMNLFIASDNLLGLLGAGTGMSVYGGLGFTLL